MIIYVDGIFDLFHSGHVEFLRQARAITIDQDCWLIVGVITDEDAQWKRKPIIPHAQRVSMLRACKYVDEIIENPPLVLTDAFLDQYTISNVVHGDDDYQESFFKAARDRDMMVYVPYTHEGPLANSTTNIISIIKHVKAD